MTTIILILSLILWILSGAASFIYWWTKDHDFTWKMIPMLIPSAIIGPISFLVGFFIHGGCSSEEVIFKKRTNN